MKKKLLPLLLALPLTANAASWFQFEAGIGAAKATDVDGVWTQHNVADNHERLTTPVYTLGVTGEAYAHGPLSLHYHADYVYIGTQRANCSCVSDEAYAAHSYNGATVGFAGSGHVQGIALTLEPGYTWHGVRMAAEAGPFLFWNTWREVVYTEPQQHVRADPGMKVGYVFGGRVERGNFSMSYRYYTHIERSTGQFPGLVNNLHTLSAVYKF
jgi:hypothetical protein